MEATLHALSGILLKAIPTFLLVIVLHFYLKYMFFKPLEKVLRARYEATEGAQKRAAESLQRAADRTAEYEAALRAAQAEAAVRQAREQLAAEILQAKAGLAAQSDTLANQIADTILSRGAAA